MPPVMTRWNRCQEASGLKVSKMWRLMHQLTVLLQWHLEEVDRLSTTGWKALLDSETESKTKENHLIISSIIENKGETQAAETKLTGGTEDGSREIASSTLATLSIYKCTTYTIVADWLLTRACKATAVTGRVRPIPPRRGLSKFRNDNQILKPWRLRNDTFVKSKLHAPLATIVIAKWPNRRLHLIRNKHPRREIYAFVELEVSFDVKSTLCHGCMKKHDYLCGVSSQSFVTCSKSLT